MTSPIDQNFNQTMTLLPNLSFYSIARCVHKTFATSVLYYQETLTPPDIMSHPGNVDLLHHTF